MQEFYVCLPTRACRTGYWGRRDLIDLTHWTTNLIAAVKWTVKVPIFISPRHSIEPCKQLSDTAKTKGPLAHRAQEIRGYPNKPKCLDFTYFTLSLLYAHYSMPSLNRLHNVWNFNSKNFKIRDLFRSKENVLGDVLEFLTEPCACSLIRVAES